MLGLRGSQAGGEDDGGGGGSLHDERLCGCCCLSKRLAKECASLVDVVSAIEAAVCLPFVVKRVTWLRINLVSRWWNEKKNEKKKPRDLMME